MISYNFLNVFVFFLEINIVILLENHKILLKKKEFNNFIFRRIFKNAKKKLVGDASFLNRLSRTPYR